MNRIGSENKDIYVYNFYPSSQGDEQINLVQNAYTKLQSFHTMFGEDAKIFSQEEELSEGNFEAIVDGEESPQEKYIAELKKYRDSNPERYDFIQKLKCAEEKSLAPLLQDEKGNTYFAIKVKNKYGCVYVKVAKDLQAQVINYMDMFDSCKCAANTAEAAFNTIENIESKRKAAMDAYHVYESKLSKAKNAKIVVSNVLIKANEWINSQKLPKESMSLIGQAMKSIKAGNTTLAKRLDKLLTELGEPDEMLIPVSPEDIVNMIKQELGNITAANTQNHGEAYIFAGFYY